MQLSAPETEKRHMEAGHWGRVTLDNLFLRAARKAGEKVFLEDPRQSITGHEAIALFHRMSALYADLGIGRDAAVAVRSGNGAMALIAFMALLNREAIAFVAPVVWSGAEIALNALPFEPRAIVDLTGLEDDAALDAAAELFTVRAVATLGITLDGTIDLAEAEPRGEVAATSEGRASHVATVHFRIDPRGRPVAIPRSHNHWIAAGLSTFLEAGFAKGTGLATSLSPMAAPSLASAIVPALLGGLPIHFGEPSSGKALTALVSGDVASHVALPARLVGFLKKSGPVRLLAVHPPDRTLRFTAPAGALVTDVHDLNHAAFLPRTRSEPARSAPLTCGPQQFPSLAEKGPVLAELHRRANGNSELGQLSMEGPGVPDAPWPQLAGVSALGFDPSGGVKTGVAAREDENGLELLGLLGDTIHVGSVPVALEALDLMLSGVPGVTEAAAFAVEDPLLGARVHAAIVLEDGAPMPAIADLCEMLRALGVSDHALPAGVQRMESLPRTATGALNRALLQPEHKARAA